MPEKEHEKIGHLNMSWHNSNKLLNNHFKGTKTGTTTTAGMCLSCLVEYEDVSLIVTILGCRNDKYRWKDMAKLALWAIR